MRQFRTWEFKDTEYFNQSVIVPVDADADMVRKALDALVLHHDMLRAVYVNETLEILSYKDSKRYELYEYDLRGEEDTEKISYEKNTEIQASIDLEHGPLMKAALYTTDKGNYLFICIHHFAVDGVSWRIITEDIETAIRCQKEGRAIKLPEKTASFIEWTKLLNEYTGSKELAKEYSYWEEVDRSIDKGRLEAEKEDNGAINRTTYFELTEETTDNLIHKAGKAYNTQINDLLLSALGIAVNKLTGQETIAVGVEGHGREAIHKAIDIDRTVGWFTSLYPVILNNRQDKEETIVNTKDMLRRIPGNGIGHGLLYRNGITGRVDVFFNYLGELSSDNHQDSFVLLSTGETVSKDNRWPGNLNINSNVANGRFNCSVIYNNCSEDLAERFAEEYKTAIEEVVEWCVNQDESHTTASDFSDQTLTNEELSEFDDMF